MNRRLGTVAGAAAVLGGALVAALPQHAASIVRVLAVTVAVVAGSLVLRAVAPLVSREPVAGALDRRPTAGAPALDPHGVRDARRDLDRPGPPGSVPPVVRDRLVAAATLAGVAVDALPMPADPATAPPVRDRDAVAARVHHVLDAIERPTATTGADHDHH